MKILHCPTTTGNNSWILAQAERKLGLDSDVMIFRNNWINYPADIDLGMSLRNPIWSIVKLVAFFVKATREYDIFHFNFGSSFIPQAIDLKWLELCDLALLKKLGKKIVVTYNGSDARQKDYCAKHFSISPYTPPYVWAKHDKKDALKRRRIEKFEYYADRVFALNPDLIRVLSAKAEFLPYTTIDPNEWKVAPTQNSNIPLIIHAPTNRDIKGTRFILDAIDKIERDYPIRFKLIENTSYWNVHRLYAQADIAIDQLLAGWYGGFAVELMALGKPVVSYIREEDLSFIPEQMKADIPIISANPDTIYSVLAWLLDNKDKLPDIGTKSRQYVERWHNPLEIAQKMKEVYESL